MQKPSIKVKGAELYTFNGTDRPNIKIMQDKFIWENETPISTFGTGWWYVVVSGKVLEKRRTLKQAQIIVNNLIKYDLI